ncbi:MAG: hypothetical protein ACRENJ_00085, partial [Candidatus Eiseniibacteriota bacterium]
RSPEPEVEPWVPADEPEVAPEPAGAVWETEEEPETRDEPPMTGDADEEDAGPRYPEVTPPPPPSPAPTWGRRNRRGR